MENNLAVQAILEEFKILREEISLYHKQQKELVNFALVLTLGLTSIFIPSITKVRAYPSVLLLFSHLFSLLGLMYADRTLRILRIADYIYNVQRPLLEKFIGQRVWWWEDYKRVTTVFNRQFAKFLDRLRWFIFLFPPISIVCAVFFLKTGKHWAKFEVACLSISIVLLVLNVITILILEESSGIREKTIVLEECRETFSNSD